MTPLVEQVASNIGPEAKVAKINVDQNKSLGPRFGIRGIPTMLVFKNGRVVDQIRPGTNVEQKLLAHADGF